jgi:alginate production protein
LRNHHAGIGIIMLVALCAPPSHAGETLVIDGHVELDYENERDFDLDDGNDADYASLEAETRLRIEYLPADSFNIVGQLRPRRKIILHEGDDRRHKEEKNRLEIEEAYLLFKPAEGYELWLGRSRFKDEREWIFDEFVDALRAFYRHDAIAIEAAWFRQTLLSNDLLRTDKEDPQNNYFVNADYRHSEDMLFTAWWMTQDEITGDAPERHYLGLRSTGEPVTGFNYWLELAHLRSDGNGEKVRGHAADLGGYYKFDAPLKPRLILGYAIGSGDGDSDDATDRTFRQTGFNDNNGRTGGVNRYKYYGETLEPELSNISILSVGAGITPHREASIELVYHRYRQQHASDSLHGNLDTDPLGADADLGREFDIVYAYNGKTTLWRINITAGYFLPGDAFGDDADNALFFGIETRRNF